MMKELHNKPLAETISPKRKKMRLKTMKDMLKASQGWAVAHMKPLAMLPEKNTRNIKDFMLLKFACFG